MAKSRAGGSDAELLRQELKEALEQQAATREILSVIAASPGDLKPVFDAIVKSAAKLCGGLMSCVFLYDGKLIHLEGIHNFSAGGTEVFQRTYPLPPEKDKILGRALLERQPVNIGDVLKEIRVPIAQKELGHRSVLAVPMLRDGKAIGVIASSRSEPGQFPERQVDLLKTFADQAVIAVENARLFEEAQARNRDLGAALEQQTATADVLKAISRSAFDLDTVLKTLIQTGIQLCEAMRGAIWLRKGELFYLAAHVGATEEWVAHALDHPIVPGPNSSMLAGHAVFTGEIVHVEDILADPRFSGIHGHGDYRTGLAVPLMREGRIEGVIGLSRTVRRLFTERQIGLVQTFADQAVIAIENVRLFEEVQARTDELDDALRQQTATADVLKTISRSAFDLKSVLQTLVESAARLCEADQAMMTRQIDGVYFRDGAYGFSPEFVDHVRTIPVEPDRGTAQGRAMLEGRVIQIPDVLADPDYNFAGAQRLGGFRTVLGVPMLREGVPIGALALTRFEVKPFTEKQIELVQTFADQAVIAIENVRLFEEVQAKTRDLSESLQQQTATANVLKVISRSTFDLDTVLSTLISSAIELCEAARGVIWLREGEEFFLAACVNYPEDWVSFAKSYRITPAADAVTATGLCAHTGEILNIEDLPHDARFRSLGAHTLGDYRGCLSVPLKREGRVEGVIGLSRPEARRFTDRQVALVQTFADQAVIAIENVRLFEEVEAKTRDLQEALQQQTATADVLKAISRSTFDLRTVLDTLVESVAKLADAAAVVFLKEGDTLRYAATYGSTETMAAAQHSVPIDRRTSSGRAVLTGVPVFIPDVRDDPDYDYSPVTQYSDILSLMAVPLISQGRVLGAFSVGKPKPGPFTARQCELVQTFADQAVIAIENVRLFEEVQARTRDLEESIEDLRTAQGRLIQTEKLASLGQLTAGIAHEIKNPLNFVNNFAALSSELISELREALAGSNVEGRAREEIEELSKMLSGNLDKVVQHGKRADSIVKNMLLHSREGSGEHRMADVNAIVEESLNLAYHGARAERLGFNITLEKALDPAAGEVDLYPQEITRVLLNLISNGFYATTKRGSASADGGYEPRLLAATRNLGDSVEIRIRDNGTGIPPHVREKMFNPFFTTKPAGEGTGLGLSLSHDIVVKQHAGSIEVETEPGEFTEFRIVLPRTAASAARTGEAK